MRLDLNLNLYRTFYVVGQSNSLTEASEKLHITQSGVSQQIKDLEEQLNVVLFYRNSKGISLTKAGKLLMEYIKNALNIINYGENKVIESQSLTDAKITIGVPSHITSFYLMDILKIFFEKYPSANITIISESTAYLMNELLCHNIDFVIDNLPLEFDNSELVVEKIGNFETCFIVNKNYASSSNKLEENKFILPLTRGTIRKKLDKVMKDNKIKLNAILEVETTDLIINAVKNNIGVGYVIKKSVEAELKNHELLELKTDIDLPHFEINLIYNEQYLSIPALNFIQDFLKKTL